MDVRYANTLVCGVCGAEEVIEDQSAGDHFSEHHGAHAPFGYVSDEGNIVGLYNPVYAAVQSFPALNTREISERTFLGADTVRRHLQKLTESGLVYEERVGRLRFFRLAEGSTS